MLAQHLVNQGAKPGTTICLVVSRSPEMIIGIVAAVKTGAAYAPVDSSFPSDRIAYIIKETGCSLILTTDGDEDKVPVMGANNKVISVTEYLRRDRDDSLTFTRPQPEDEVDRTAIMIFTSGTTGKPKGVRLHHQGVLNIVSWDALQLGPESRIMQFMAIGFDACAWECFSAFAHGATLVLRGDDLFTALKTATHLIITPTGLSQLDSSELTNLKTIVVAGEPCPQELVNRWATQATMLNAYGPTEISIISHLGWLEPMQDVRVGRPVPNSKCYILDDRLQRVPLGMPGEVVIGGMGVSLGYLNNPELTNERFVDNPFHGGKMYRTGDIGKWERDGQVTILGRKDDMVKVKGYRIELDEIVTAICHLPGVTGAVALVKDALLVAFVTPQSASAEGIRASLMKSLPFYMVPSTIQPLEKFPMNANGKADRNALRNMVVETSAEAPTDAREEKLAAIWAAVLNVEVGRIGKHTSFFEVGGDSISAIRLVAKCREAGWGLSTADVFKHQTLELMSAIVSEMAASVDVTYGPVAGFTPLTPIQMWYFGNKFDYFNQSFCFKIRERVSLAAVTNAIEEIVAHHDIFRAIFRRDEANGWEQVISEVDEHKVNVSYHPDTTEDQLAGIIEHAEASIDMASGPIYAVHLLELPQEQILHFAVHHLIIDLVSWRIVIEDLTNLLRGGTMPMKSMPFKTWSERLLAHAETVDASVWQAPQSLGYIQGLMHQTSIESPDLSRNDATTWTSSATLEPALANLLDESNAAYRTNTQDLILAGLLMSFAAVSGGASLDLIMEGHGREPWSNDLDVTRTVGWFTTVYPVSFCVDGFEKDALTDTGAFIVAAKEGIRSVPDRGFTFGVARYLRKDARLQGVDRIPISFNYLGRFQSLEAQDALLELVDVGEIARLPDIRTHDLMIIVSHSEGSLRLSMSFNPRTFSQAKVDQWAAAWASAMTQIVEHCTSGQQ
ncbi:hypothetical protein HK102_007548, partial [Quaeritorhiza haematococci]